MEKSFALPHTSGWQVPKGRADIISAPSKSRFSFN
jgi:hypothetical protein